MGFDLFIGDAKYLGKGLGKLCIDHFTKMLFKISNVKRIIADPNPKNEKIVRLLLSIGFKNKGLIHTPDGEAYLMELV